MNPAREDLEIAILSKKIVPFLKLQSILIHDFYSIIKYIGKNLGTLPLIKVKEHSFSAESVDFIACFVN